MWKKVLLGLLLAVFVVIVAGGLTLFMAARQDAPPPDVSDLMPERRFVMAERHDHKLRNGRLPESLDELVPDYLEAVPVDDFDGRPLRYSRDKRMLWSVGEGLVDSGGRPREAGPEEDVWTEEGVLVDDITCYIDF